MSYRLPHKQDGFYGVDENNILQLHADMLPTFQVSLHQRNSDSLLVAPVSIRTTQ
ncbi:MAG: hypothetical protein Q8O99_00295 [bacterium]|nr:hypothetical protein [bacterium]